MDPIRGHAFDWSFLENMGRWTVRLAVVVSLAGSILTREPRFAVSCMLGAGVDVFLLQWVAHRGQAAVAAGRFDTALAAVFLIERIAIKAVLLVAAMLVPAILDFWGMVAGVVVFDVTVMTVGAFVSARRTLRGQS